MRMLSRSCIFIHRWWRVPCHPEPFGFAQDRQREGSQEKEIHRSLRFLRMTSPLRRRMTGSRFIFIVDVARAQFSDAAVFDAQDPTGING